jgi:hypothetical protein
MHGQADEPLHDHDWLFTNTKINFACLVNEFGLLIDARRYNSSLAMEHTMNNGDISTFQTSNQIHDPCHFTIVRREDAVEEIKSLIL